MTSIRVSFLRATILRFWATHRVLHSILGRRAASITTVSHFLRDAISRFNIAPFEKIKVIYDGNEHALRWKRNRSQMAADLEGPFILLVGSKAPHKNMAIIFSIAAELASNGIRIVVAGGEDTNVFTPVSGPSPPSNVQYLGKVGDDDLAVLYSRALCLVFPSKMEGFGLPVLEAMALGCPVISSNAGSLPEICGEAALYARPDDPQSWLEAITQIIAEPRIREDLANRGRARSKAFSWREGAKIYLQLMHTIDSDI